MEQPPRFEELERLLVDPEVLANSARLAAVAREHGSLAKLATKYRRFKQLNEQIAEAMEMVAGADPEIRQLAEAEMPELKAERKCSGTRLLDMTIGGEDATHPLRAGDPRRHRRRRGGPVRPRPLRNVQALRRGQPLEGGGPRHDLRPNWAGSRRSSSGLEGEGVYRELQYESGGHRVQRVPETEAKGRIHTSAATVAVMAEPEDVEIDLKPDDYRKDIFHASGPGGQHVNKTASRHPPDPLCHAASWSAARTRRASTRTWPRPCGC